MQSVSSVVQTKSVVAPPLVVGAGMAGLSAALHLAERGLPPLVLEADPHYPGGRVAGGDIVELTHAGRTWHFRDEHGVHGIWSGYHNLQAMLTRHNTRPMFVPAQEESWIYKHRGRIYGAAVGSAIRHSWVPAPLHFLALFVRPRFLSILGLRDWLSLPRVWAGLLFAVGIDPLREGQPLAGLTLGDFVKSWPPAMRAMFAGLSRNFLSAHPEETPLSGFVGFLRFYMVLRRDAWAYSYMPADGGSSLIEPLVAKLCEVGGALKLGHTVTHLEQKPDGWCVHWRRENGQTGATHTPHLILATDAPNTEKILDASHPSTFLPRAEETGEGPTVLRPSSFVYYYPRAMPTAIMRLWYGCLPGAGAEAGVFSGEFVLDNYFWLHRLQDAYAAWHKATGGSAVEVHLYGPPEMLEQPDAVLLAHAATDVHSAFPKLRGHLIHQTLRRNDATHTVFGVGPGERHLGIHTPWPNLFCCGDWVRYPSPALFLERACVTGIEAANAVLATHDLPPWPLLQGPPPEALAGFIQRLMLRGRRARRRKRI
jgi:isorenieratene synthase